MPCLNQGIGLCLGIRWRFAHAFARAAARILSLMMGRLVDWLIVEWNSRSHKPTEPNVLASGVLNVSLPACFVSFKLKLLTLFKQILTSPWPLPPLCCLIAWLFNCRDKTNIQQMYLGSIHNWNFCKYRHKITQNLHQYTLGHQAGSWHIWLLRNTTELDVREAKLIEYTGQRR